MKYTFTTDAGKEKTVEIPDDYIAKNKKNLGITTKEAIELWLYDNDYIGNAEADALTEKAKGCGIHNKADSKPRKKPARKPDYIKRALVCELAALFNELSIDTSEDGSSHLEQLQSVVVLNKERTVSFKLGEDTYEVTLSKKRKPKK